jgi:hypothetical protein
VTRAVPLSYRLLQRQHRSRFVVRQRWRIAAWHVVGGVLGVAAVAGPDERHEEFERAYQRQRWPRADQRTYRTVAARSVFGQYRTPNERVVRQTSTKLSTNDPGFRQTE